VWQTFEVEERSARRQKQAQPLAQG